MAAVLHRVLIFFLVLALAAGTSGRFVPSGIDHTDMATAGMVGGPGAPDSPCPGHTPNCVDHLGCIAAPALPAAPAAMAVALAWVSLDYEPAPQSLSGISVQPELSPPILAA